MKVNIDEPYIENITIHDGNVPIGGYLKHYKNSRTYVAELEHLEIIMISVAYEENFVRVLVRSVFGFKEYNFYKEHTYGEITLYCIKNGLLHYFNDTIPNWGQAETRKKRRGGLMSSLGSFFGISFENKSLKGDNVIHEVKNTLHEKIAFQMLEDPKRYTPESIINKLVEVPQGIASEFEIEYFSTPIRVNMVCESPEDLPADMLGAKVNLTEEDIEVANAYEISLIKLTSKDKSQEKLNEALIDFLLSEIEYFNAINYYYKSTVVQIQESEEIGIYRKLYTEFVTVYKLQRGIMEDIPTVFKRFNINLKDMIENPKSFKDFLNTIETSKCEMTGEEVENEILKAFGNKFNKFTCYADLMLTYEEALSYLAILKQNGYDYLPDAKRMSDSFSHCLQRVVRYHFIINGILKHMDSESPNFLNFKKLYVKFQKLLKLIDQKKRDQDALKATRKIIKRISGMDENVKIEHKKFIAQLDCETKEGYATTMFLFTDMLIITERTGPAEHVLKNSRSTYYYWGMLKINDIEVAPSGTDGLKISVLRNVASYGDLFDVKRTFKDASLAILYFFNCPSNARATFLEETRILGFSSSKNLYSSHGNLLIQVLSKNQKIVGNSDIVIYVDSQHSNDKEEIGLTVNEMVSNTDHSNTIAGFLDLNNSVLELKDQDELIEYTFKNKYTTEEFRSNFKMFLMNAVQAKNSHDVSTLSLLRFQLSLKLMSSRLSVLEPVNFSNLLKYDDKLLMNQIHQRARSMMCRIERSLPYLRGSIDFKKKIISYDPNIIKTQSMLELYQKIIYDEGIESFVDHSTNDVLYLLFHFFKHNIYCFLSYEDINFLYDKMLLNFDTYTRGVSLGISSKNAPFISSLVSMMVIHKTKIDMGPVFDAFKFIFKPFGVTDEQLHQMLMKTFA